MHFHIMKAQISWDEAYGKNKHRGTKKVQHDKPKLQPLPKAVCRVMEKKDPPPHKKELPSILDENDFPRYIAVGNERRIFRRTRMEMDGALCRYKRDCSGDTVSVEMREKKRVKKNDPCFFRVVKYKDIKIIPKLKAFEATQDEWQKSDAPDTFHDRMDKVGY